MNWIYVHVGESRFPRTAVSNVGMATGDIYEMNSAGPNRSYEATRPSMAAAFRIHIK